MIKLGAMGAQSPLVAIISGSKVKVKCAKEPTQTHYCVELN